MNKDNYIFRPIKKTDFDQFSQLVEQIPIGMGTKYKHGPEKLYQLICKSERDFKQDVQKPNGEAYIFVVEYDNKLIGTLSVYANHRQTKFWSYRICDQSQVMTLSTDFSGCSSFGSHFVDKNYRKTPTALILVRRVVEYINHNPHRFTKTIISESRGVYNSKKKQFWNYVAGKKYRVFDFDQYIAALLNNAEEDIIDDLKKKIKMDNMPNYLKKLINQEHEETTASIKLFRRRFQPTDHVAYSTGGPIFTFNNKGAYA